MWTSSHGSKNQRKQWHSGQTKTGKSTTHISPQTPDTTTKIGPNSKPTPAISKKITLEGGVNQQARKSCLHRHTARSVSGDEQQLNMPASAKSRRNQLQLSCYTCLLLGPQTTGSSSAPQVNDPKHASCCSLSPAVESAKQSMPCTSTITCKQPKSNE
jgi:hypothetical protein